MGSARVTGPQGKTIFSHTFDINRGVIQGGIISPVFFVIALDQLIQKYDVQGSGIKVGHIKMKSES